MKRLAGFGVSICLFAGIGAVSSKEVTNKGTSAIPATNLIARQWTTPPDEQSRFQPFGLNYGIWQKTEDDDSSLEGHFSFQYSIYDCRRGQKEESAKRAPLTCAEKAYFQPAFFVSYTGEFDFYAGTRDSSPVVNRLNNPAAHLRVLIDNYERLQSTEIVSPALRYFEVALEHRSNGQDKDIEETNAEGELKTQVAYESDDHEFFDSISRSANYVSFSTGTMNVANSSYNFKVSAKAYIDHDSDVNWGDKADDDPGILDYDILRLYASKQFDFNHVSWLEEITVAAEYTVGKEGSDTDSADLILVVPIVLFEGAFTLPLMAKAHFGPLDTLSNYTKSSNSFGVGLAFWF